jgi:hypothetical protein
MRIDQPFKQATAQSASSSESKRLNEVPWTVDQPGNYNLQRVIPAPTWHLVSTI